MSMIAKKKKKTEKQLNSEWTGEGQQLRWGGEKERARARGRKGGGRKGEESAQAREQS